MWLDKASLNIFKLGLKTFNRMASTMLKKTQRTGGLTYLRYTVLTSPKKGETAVHCCDPAISVLVMLVSRNVFHVVSALQSIVCHYIFLADQIFYRSYVGSAYRLRSLAVSGFSSLDHF